MNRNLNIMSTLQSLNLCDFPKHLYYFYPKASKTVTALQNELYIHFTSKLYYNIYIGSL